MSEIKSNSDDLVLNSDGGTSTIKFQTNGVERGSISTTGAFTATTIDATALTGALPAISGASLTNLPAGGVDGIVSTANATAITIDSNENVGIGGSPDTPLHVKIANNATLNTSNGDAARYYGAKIENSSTTQWAMAPLAFRVAGADSLIIGFKDSPSANTGGLSFFTDGGTPSEKLRILSGGGITFNGDTATANAMDDYEEGTFTPTLMVGTGCSIGTVYVAKYTKVGNLVTLVSAFQLLAPSSPSNTGIRFGGFPYGFVSGDNGGWPITIHYNYKQTTNLYMDRAGYCYYQNGIVNGNNLENLGNALRSTNYMSINITYMTS